MARRESLVALSIGMAAAIGGASGLRHAQRVERRVVLPNDNGAADAIDPASVRCIGAGDLSANIHFDLLRYIHHCRVGGAHTRDLENE